MPNPWLLKIVDITNQTEVPFRRKHERIWYYFNRWEVVEESSMMKPGWEYGARVAAEENTKWAPVSTEDVPKRLCGGAQIAEASDYGPDYGFHWTDKNLILQILRKIAKLHIDRSLILWWQFQTQMGSEGRPFCDHGWGKWETIKAKISYQTGSPSLYSFCSWSWISMKLLMMSLLWKNLLHLLPLLSYTAVELAGVLHALGVRDRSLFAVTVH